MKFSTYVIFFLLFGLMPDLFITFGAGVAPVWKILAWAPTAAALLSLVFIGLDIHYIGPQEEIAV